MDMEKHIDFVYNPTISERYKKGKKDSLVGLVYME